MQKQKGKVAVVGNCHSGKTSLLQQYCNNQFPKDYNMTLGGEMHSKLTRVEGCEKDIHLFFIDLAGQDIYRKMLPSLMADVQLVMVVFDCTDVESFQSIRYWYDLVVQNNKNQRLPGVLVSTKNDNQAMKVISMGEASQQAQKMGLDFFECSAVKLIIYLKKARNIDVEQPFTNLAEKLVANY